MLRKLSFLEMHIVVCYVLFKGWTALTSAGPGEGSLMLYPCIK
jgi:hypothetical protein